MGLLAWSLSTAGMLPASTWDLQSEPQTDVVSAAWHFTAGSGCFPICRRWGGTWGLQRSPEAAGCWYGLVAASPAVAAMSPGSVAGTAELPS